MTPTPPEDDVRVRVRQLPHAAGLPLPAYETAGAAGLDVRAAIEQPIDAVPGAITRIPTGLAVELPPGYELQLRPRSGLATKHGLTLANSPATIDSDYRGEMVVSLVVLGPDPVRIERGMRIAQMVLARVPRLAWEPVETLAPSARGEGGFGHTGIE
jgi:deoxyuridine 5'-triphosphate nucleotidohydrolase